MPRSAVYLIALAMIEPCECSFRACRAESFDEPSLNRGMLLYFCMNNSERNPADFPDRMLALGAELNAKAGDYWSMAGPQPGPLPTSSTRPRGVISITESRFKTWYISM